MKIVQQNDKLLVLKRSNFNGIVIGLAFAIFGILFFVTYVSSSGISLSSVIPSLIMVAIGLSFFLFSKNETVSFDKNQNKMIIFRKGIVGSSNKEYVLGDIAGIELVEEYVMSNNGPAVGLSMNNPATNMNQQYYNRAPERFENFIVVMKDGTRVPIDRYQSNVMFSISGVSLPGVSIGPTSADAAASFLGVQINRISAFGVRSSGGGTGL